MEKENRRQTLLRFMNWVIDEEGMTYGEKRASAEAFVDDYLDRNKLEPPTIVERYADNGAISHYVLLDSNGNEIWSGWED